MRVAALALLVLAAALNSGWLFFVVALFVAIHLAARLWVDRVGAGLRVERLLEQRAFFGETVAVTLRVANTSTLPVPWLRLREHRPAALILPSTVSTVVALGAGATARLAYEVPARRRGYHAIGPLALSIGDVFGLWEYTYWFSAPHYLLVYPQVVPLDRLALPTLTLFGDLRSRRTILGDPARLAGVRDYVRGDPLNTIHWPATARTGTLQVKQFQPATTVQTTIMVNMDRRDYTLPDVGAATDLAVTIAASVAAHLLGQRQEVGLLTNGQVALPPADVRAGADAAVMVADPAALDKAARSQQHERGDRAPRFRAAPVQTGKGRGHLMRILDMLARVETVDHTSDFQALLHKGLELPAGSTVVAITGSAPDDLFGTLHRLREAGLLVVLLVVERGSSQEALRARAVTVGVRAHAVPAVDALAALGQTGLSA